jgi:Family of unknown function (DUF6491)
MSTRNTVISAALLAAGLVSASTLAAPAAPTPEASIPFIQHNSIRDWQANKQEGLWIQDTRRHWYYAQLMGPCFGLDYAWQIAFDTRSSGTLDKFSAIVVPREGRCQIRSLTRSEGPPKRKAKSAVLETEVEI